MTPRFQTSIRIFSLQGFTGIPDSISIRVTNSPGIQPSRQGGVTSAQSIAPEREAFPALFLILGDLKFWCWIAVALDTLALESKMAPIRERLNKLDLIIEKIESWDRVSRDLSAMLSSHEQYFGNISRLQEQGLKLDEVSAGILAIDDKIENILEYLKEISYMLKQDTSLSEISRHNLLAGIRVDAEFDIHSRYDFLKSPDYIIGRGALGRKN